MDIAHIVGYYGLGENGLCIQYKQSEFIVSFQWYKILEKAKIYFIENNSSLHK